MRKSSYVNIRRCLERINSLLDKGDDFYEVAKLYQQIGGYLADEDDFEMATKAYLMGEKYGMNMLSELKNILETAYGDSERKREIYLKIISCASISGGYFFGLLGSMYEDSEKKMPSMAYKYFLLGAEKGDSFSIKRALSYVGFFTDYEEMYNKETALLLYTLLLKKNTIEKWNTFLLYEYAMELITLPCNENDVEKRKRTFFKVVQEILDRGFIPNFWSKILSLAEDFFFFNKQGTCECIVWSPEITQKLLLMICETLKNKKGGRVEKEFMENLKKAVYTQYLYLDYIGEKEKAELFLRFI